MPEKAGKTYGAIRTALESRGTPIKAGIGVVCASNLYTYLTRPVPKGKVCDTPVSLIDCYQTILHGVGLT